MVKIRIGGMTGIDIKKVVGWRFSRNPNPGCGDCDITVFFRWRNAIDSRDSVGELGFSRLDKILMDEFPIDFGASEKTKGVLEW
jgi:hypothetical protein